MVQNLDPRKPASVEVMEVKGPGKAKTVLVKSTDHHRGYYLPLRWEEVLWGNRNIIIPLPKGRGKSCQLLW